MIGTPESRLTLRQQQRRELARKNAVMRAFSTVQPGTLALLNACRGKQSMDVFLYRLVREGRLVEDFTSS